MAARKKPFRKSPRAQQRVGQRRPKRASRAHLLIIECDYAKLAADGLNLGIAFGQLAKKVFPEKRIVVLQTFSEERLKQDLADIFKQYGRFRSILIVGHSNESGLVLTGDGHRSWSAIGSWLQIFEPEFLFLAACQAGKSEAVRCVFQSIKTLRQIYGSPVALYQNQVPPLAILIGCLLKDGRLDEDQAGALRIANYVLTGGQLFRWKRAETGPGEEIKARLWDGVASVLNQGSWDLLASLFPGARTGPTHQPAT